VTLPPRERGGFFLRAVGVPRRLIVTLPPRERGGFFLRAVGVPRRLMVTLPPRERGGFFLSIHGVQFMRRFLRHLLPLRLRHIRRCRVHGRASDAGKAAWLRSHFGLPDPSAS
jgi:hypothetical protein